MRRNHLGLLLIGMPVALLTMGACSNNKQPSAPTSTSYEGEYCENQDQCNVGLVCDGNVCRKVCQNDNDCSQNQQCKEDRCIPKSGPTVTTDLPEGSTCDDNNLCAEGLKCKRSVCTKVECEKDGDCNNDAKECQNYKCVDKPIKQPEVPQGGALTPMATTLTGGTLKVQVLGGDTYNYQSGSQKVQINDAAWH